MSTVHVSNISPNTTERDVNDFFSFCGKIISVSLSPVSNEPNALKSATVTFERSSAAKTALLLDQTRLAGNNVHVEAAPSLDDLAGGEAKGHADEPNFGADDDATYPRQEDKPRAAILAEYLSAGYAVGDTALQKGIELDQKAGISARFASLLQTLDSKLHAVEKAKSVEQTYHVTDQLKRTQNTLSQYFEAALNNPTGKKVRDFYSAGAKQALDIHNEARRLAELKKQDQQKAGGNSSSPFVGPAKTTCSCGGNEGVCTCPEGKCACAGCNKADQAAPTVGTAQGGEASRQFGHAAEDIKATVKDLNA